MAATSTPLIGQFRKKRRNLTLGEKIEIIRIKEETKCIDQDLAYKYEVDRSVISKILARRDEIRRAVSESNDLERMRIQKGKLHLVETAVYKWFLSARSLHIPISQRILQHKAVQFYNQFKQKPDTDLPDTFVASSGWVTNFQARFKITGKSICGESDSVDMSLVEKERPKIKQVLSDYVSDNIYNADELGLFYRLGPNQTLATVHDKAKGTKKKLERLTILLASNARGTRKLKPFVIGKSENPRCFKDVNKANLPVRYSSNDSAWMTGEKWLGWLRWLDNELTEKSILLADNCPAHVVDTNANYKHLTVYYLPPNTTSVLQPFDAGIINSFKANYKNALTKHMIELADKNQIYKSINVYQAIEMIDEAWDQVTQQTIENCFLHTDLLPLTFCTERERNQVTRSKDLATNFYTKRLDTTIKALLESYERFADEITLERLRENCSNINNLVDVDKDAPVFEVPNDDEIISEVMTENGLLTGRNLTFDDSDDDEMETISFKDASHHYKQLKRYCMKLSTISSQDLLALKNVFSKIELEHSQNLKQTNILDFFN